MARAPDTEPRPSGCTGRQHPRQDPGSPLPLAAGSPRSTLCVPPSPSGQGTEGRLAPPALTSSPQSGLPSPWWCWLLLLRLFRALGIPEPSPPLLVQPSSRGLERGPLGGWAGTFQLRQAGRQWSGKGQARWQPPVMAAWPTPERARGHPRQPPSPGLGLLPLARAAGCPHLPGAPASVSSASRPSASALLTAPRPGPPLPPESVSSVMKSGRQADGPGHSRAAASGAVREGFRALVSAESRGGAGRGRGGRDGCRSFAVLGWTAPRRLGMSTSPVTSPGGV